MRSQDSVMTDLLNKYAAAKIDTQKAELSFKIGERNWFSRNLSQAASYLRSSIVWGERSGYTVHIVNAHNLLSNIYLQSQQFDSVFYFLENGLQKATALNDPSFTPSIYQTYSHVYFDLGDYSRAADHALKAAALYEQSKDPVLNMQAVFAYLLAGNTFEKIKEDNKAMQYYTVALEKGRTSKENWYIKSPMSALAGIYVKLGNYTRAKSLYDSLILIDSDAISKEPTMFSHAGLGTIALKEKNYATALKEFRLAIEYAEEKNLSKHRDNFSMNIGHAFLLSGQYDSATFYFEKAKRLALAARNKLILRDIYKLQADMAVKQNNYDLAFENLQHYNLYADSLLNEESLATVHKLDALYQVTKKEKEISKLQISNTEKKLALVKRNRLMLIGGIAAAAIVFITLLLYRNSRQRAIIAEKEHRLQTEQVRFLKEQQQVVSLQSMINGQETERTRIAKDLHDGLGGLFSTVKMYFSTLEHEQEFLKNNPLFRKSYEMINMASVEIRRIAHNMMPEVLMKLGLIPAIQDMCSNISAGKLLQVKLQSYGMEERLNASTEIMLYRIIQELLNNIIKHAQASEAIVQFNRDDNRLHVTVEDNGKGFNTREAETKGHAGLETIRSRVNYLKGNLSIDSQQEIGTTVMMEFLLNNQA